MIFLKLNLKSIILFAFVWNLLYNSNDTNNIHFNILIHEKEKKLWKSKIKQLPY